MIRSHRFLARSLAAFLIVIQALAGGAVAVAHAGQMPGGTSAVLEAPSDGVVLHGDVTCPFCVLASSQAEHTPLTFVTLVAATPSQPETPRDDAPRVIDRTYTPSSPRAPPAPLS